MNEFIAVGIMFQVVIMERDEAGHVIQRHIGPLRESLWPYLDINELVEQQVRELAQPAPAPGPAEKKER